MHYWGNADVFDPIGTCNGKPHKFYRRLGTRDSSRTSVLSCPSSTGMTISETLPSPTRSAIGCSAMLTASPCWDPRGERRTPSPTPEPQRGYAPFRITDPGVHDGAIRVFTMAAMRALCQFGTLWFVNRCRTTVFGQVYRRPLPLSPHDARLVLYSTHAIQLTL